MAQRGNFGGRKNPQAVPGTAERPKQAPYIRTSETMIPPQRKGHSVPTSEGEREQIYAGFVSSVEMTPTISPISVPKPPEEPVEYENVTNILLRDRKPPAEPVRSVRITTTVKPLESVSEEEVAALDSKRIKALLELEQQVEREREGFLKQINKQFQEEKKLNEKMAKMEEEYQTLRKDYLQAVKKSSEAEDRIKLLLNNDGGFYSSVALLEEEKVKMKEEIRGLKIRQRTLEETNNTIHQILENFKEDLKNSLDEKQLLVDRINAGLENEARMERENQKLRDELGKLKEEKCSVAGIINQLRESVFVIHMYGCTTWKQKVKLMRAALRSEEPNVILTVTLFLAATLSEANFFTIISAKRYGVALDLYLVYLKQTNDLMKLARLYQHLERYEDAGMLMLRQAFAQEDVGQRIMLLQACVEFFRQHKSLEWYADELASKLNEERLAREIVIQE